MDRELFVTLEKGNFIDIQSLHGGNQEILLGVTFQGDTPLHIAAREGYQDIVEWILQEQPSLAEALNKDDNTPLHEAAKSGNLQLVKILLQRNTNLASQRNKFGETALIIASKYGYLETVNYLLGVNDTTIQATHGGGSASHLHAAVHGGHLEIVQAMLNSPAWNNDLMIEKDERGMCAVHVAAMKGRWDIINEFMSRWPDCVQIRSGDHKSVLHLAVEYNQWETVRNIVAKVRELFNNQLPQKFAEFVSRDHDRFHNTSLHLAAKNGVNPQLVKYLVSFPGVDVNALNDESMSAVDIASAAPHNPNCAIIVRYLRAAGGIRSSLTPISNTSSNPSDDSKQVEETNIVNTHMVVASLIATVTFAAMFQIPGGIEDDRASIHYGAAKMAFHTLFKLFIYSDTAAFTTSFTVVVAWLARQLFTDTYFGRRSALSRLSGLTLLVSILWMIVAFVSANIIGIIPPNYENLKSKHNDAFSEYKAILTGIIVVAIIPLFTVGLRLWTLILHERFITLFEDFITLFSISVLSSRISRVRNFCYLFFKYIFYLDVIFGHVSVAVCIIIFSLFL